MKVFGKAQIATGVGSAAALEPEISWISRHLYEHLVRRFGELTAVDDVSDFA